MLQAAPKKRAQYCRFLDVIWGVWTHSLEDFRTFVRSLNNINPSVTVKVEIHSESVNFLDTTTFKGPDFYSTKRLDTKVYLKTTDTHVLLYMTSHHPKHTYAGVIKSQLLHFHKICSRRDDFNMAVKVLYMALTTRGYSRSFLRNAIKDFQITSPAIDSPLLPTAMDFSISACKFRRIKQNFKKETQQSYFLQKYRLIYSL